MDICPCPVITVVHGQRPSTVLILMSMPSEPTRLSERDLLAAFRARFDAISGQVTSLMNERTAIASIIRGLEQLVGEPNVSRHVDHHTEHKVPEFYSITAAAHQRVHHNNDACQSGRDIHPRERKAGSGGYPLCAFCAQLNSGYYAELEHAPYRMIAGGDIDSALTATSIESALHALMAGGDRELTAAEIVAWLAERGRRVNYQALYKALRREAEKPNGIIGKSGEQFFARPRAGRGST
jgi:hypothetical protein